MKQGNKAINFCEGKICIKDENGNFCFQDDTCVTQILTEIDEYIEKRPNQLKISTIIFDVLKSHFEVDEIFFQKNSHSFQPNNDPLYNSFSKYIRNHPIYSERINKVLNQSKTTYEIIKQKKDLLRILDDYAFESKMRSHRLSRHT